MRGTVGGSGVQSAGGGVLGGLGAGAGNLLSTMLGTSPVGRKAERMVVRLNVCSRTVLSTAKDSSSLKSEQPVRVAASRTPFAQSAIMKRRAWSPILSKWLRYVQTANSSCSFNFLFHGTTSCFDLRPFHRARSRCRGTLNSLAAAEKFGLPPC